MKATRLEVLIVAMIIAAILTSLVPINANVFRFAIATGFIFGSVIALAAAALVSIRIQRWAMTELPLRKALNPWYRP